jgi:hypothetical protein
VRDVEQCPHAALDLGRAEIASASPMHRSGMTWLTWARYSWWTTPAHWPLGFGAVLVTLAFSCHQIAAPR